MTSVKQVCYISNMEKGIDVKELRKQLGLTQDEFAVKLGVAPYTVRRWESGKTQPSRMAKRLLMEIQG